MRRLAFLLLLVLLPSTWAQSVSEELLLEKPKLHFAGHFSKLPVFRASGTHVAWITTDDKRHSLFIDGKPVVTDADRVSMPIYSPDGAHVAYAVRRGNDTTVFHDGQPRGPSSAVSWGEPAYLFVDWNAVLSPDGKHVAWNDCVGNARELQCSARRDGEVLGMGGGTIRFLADNKLLYLASRDKQWFLMLDGKEILRSDKFWEKFYSPFQGLTLSPDLKRYACVGWRVPALIGKASTSDKTGAANEMPVMWLGYSMIVDGKVDSPSDRTPEVEPVAFGSPVFSPNGTRLAYVVVESEEKKGFWDSDRLFKGRVKVDDALGPIFQSGRGAFGRENRRRPSFVGEGQTPGAQPFPLATSILDPNWFGVGTPAFSPDSQHVAYSAKRGARDFVIVLDGKIQDWPHAERILAGPMFTPDSKHVIYIAYDGGQSMVVMDGVIKNKQPADRDSFAESFAFTPDGKLAYVMGIGGNAYWNGGTNKARRRVVVDGVAGKEYDCNTIDHLRFSSDGKHVAYMVHTGAFLGKKTVVLDGQEGKPYDEFFPDSFRFTERGSLTYVAADQRGYYRVTHAAQ